MPSLRADRRLPRALHPGAWWLWALGLATVASRTTNPFVLLLVVGVAGYVVSARRSDAPWARSFGMFLKLGLVVIAIRVVFQTLLGAPVPGTVLVTLPELALPDWAAGISIGGPISLEAVVLALVDGLRLATMLACIGAANALANPKRLLATLPTALYEVGVAVVVALSVAPSLLTSVQRIRAARRLRGRPDRGVRSIITVAMPVLEDALERSLALAAAMDSRGYGRRAAVPAATRRLTAVLTLAGLGGVTLGTYGLLDGTGPTTLGLPVLLVGLTAAVGGLALGGRGRVRTRYRPDPWRTAESVTVISAVVAATTSIVAGTVAPGALHPTLAPLALPPLPLGITVGVLVALLPAWVTPPPITTTASRHRATTRPSPRSDDASPRDVDASPASQPVTGRRTDPQADVVSRTAEVTT